MIQHHDIVHEVLWETDAQIEKWGVQDHPMGTKASAFNKRNADEARKRTDEAAKAGTVTYADIVREEYYEMIAENPGEEMEKEAIQTAACLVTMVAASRRARGAV